MYAITGAICTRNMACAEVCLEPKEMGEELAIFKSSLFRSLEHHKKLQIRCTIIFAIKDFNALQVFNVPRKELSEARRLGVYVLIKSEYHLSFHKPR